MKKELHIVSHTHWDREWYMSFPRHRYRLIKLMDELIEVAEKDDSFKSFHLDGQTILLDDYIAVRPSMRQRLKKLIERGKLKIGPFYILQDEYLVDGESNVRNIVYGLKTSKEWGEPAKVGYFPDAFGNISQVPQILRGFDLECVYFGRGIVPMGYANTVLGKGDEGFAEIVWEGADGSRVVGIQFINWYHNAMEIPSDLNSAKQRLQEIVDSLKNITRTPYLLGMNGCDHTPVQKDIGQIIRDVGTVDKVEVIHSDLYSYFKKIEPYKGSFSVYRGEICGQNGNGYYNLINTASSRIYLKQLNVRAQNLLEFQLEPLSVMAQRFGKAYDTEIIDFCWKTLLSNHPHDSICGCSCDEVCDEMAVRFKSAIDMAQYKADDLKEFIVAQLDIPKDKSIVVFNPDVQTLSGGVSGYVDYFEGETVPDNIVLCGEDGGEVSAEIEFEGKTQVVELPDDAFRRLYHTDRFRINFRAEGVPPLSVKVYHVKTAKSGKPFFKASAAGMENEFYALKFNADGSFDFTDRQSGVTYKNNNYFEDCSDKGDEYTFEYGGKTSVGLGKEAQVALLQRSCYHALFRVETDIDGTKITSFIRGEKGCPLIKIKTRIDNEKCDHRIRALFESHIKTDVVTAEGGYDFTKRKIHPGERFTNPCNTQRMNNFVFMRGDDGNGIFVAGKGLHEYEVLRDGNNTLALTLLRGIGRLGDWIELSTPDAQVQGLQEVEYAVGAVKDAALQEAFTYCKEKLFTVFSASHRGIKPPEEISISGEDLVFTTAVKREEDGEGTIVRLYNPSEKAVEISACRKAEKCKLNESAVSDFDGKINPKEIVTLKF